MSASAFLFLFYCLIDTRLHTNFEFPPFLSLHYPSPCFIGLAYQSLTAVIRSSPWTRTRSRPPCVSACSLCRSPGTYPKGGSPFCVAVDFIRGFRCDLSHRVHSRGLFSVFCLEGWTLLPSPFLSRSWSLICKDEELCRVAPPDQAQLVLSSFITCCM